ncbi:O-antigen ligase family protein [Yersinia ruckeri]|uniref:O-antigen ligase family protein n=1 Tax=Yersinia ruckeri TaxID=29486 RepID=UPI0009C17A73|nr:O-antigen ligase family protein [Yersinia ruckeri]EKN4696537.1 O-antigen ligase C-terminal domain-containing protein [Yersinia ruckeri]ELM3741176.1 O-antigen ligase C-terminal domain-containing protein [Yersinia ruckeri]MCK8538045.1 Wzy polymerase domain-containing protein [Yersinia ruckeri]MCK8543375.1 Wzy polymerase domain-containing protein [Yersinia ruckeri]MCK8552836.1 Wzy polymerase domain-containing protein [Yersinia ruckeri]
MSYHQKKNTHRNYHDWSLITLGILLFWLIFIMPIYLPNMGGSGLKLPQNIITCGVIAAITATLWLTMPARKIIHFTVTSHWILLGVLILAIPLLYTAPHWRDAAFSRWLGLATGVVFYLSWLQSGLSHRWFSWVLYGVLGAVTVQASITLLQFIAPDYVPAWFVYPIVQNRPYGVFQQVNVLASFIATGLALVLLLFLLPGFALARNTLERSRKCLLGLILVLFSVLLVWLQSRIGWLGGGIAGAMLLLLGYRTDKRQTLIASGLIVLGMVFAILLQNRGAIENIEHTASTHARLIILHDTLRMIAEKPWLGWGYGGFEYNFQHYRLAQGLSTSGLDVVRHPHNEILLWWSEGGVVAAIGILILIFAGTRLGWQVWRQSRQTQGLNQQVVDFNIALTFVLIPILLHTQTEYPFSLSAAHWVIFLLLFAQLDRQVSTVSEWRSLSPIISTFLGGAILAISLGVVVLSGGALYANLALTSLERNHWVDIEPARRAIKFDPWVNSERWHYDKQMYSLLVFNRTQDPRLLEEYRHWAQDYLSRRIDMNVYATWLSIAQYQQDMESYKRIHQEAQGLFPEDPRFSRVAVQPAESR